MPDKEEKKKGMDQFCVGEEKDLGAGEDVLFQNTGTTKLMQTIFWNLSAHAFSLFSLGLVGSNGNSLCYLTLNMHATRFSKKKKIILVILKRKPSV